jgi:hypothetical protein
MVDPLEMAGDVVVGGTALAGLVLIYLGMLVAGYGGFQREQQATVRGGYQVRAWFSFVGMVLAILAAMLAIVGKWVHVPCMVATAIVVLLVALLWGVALAFLTVREIR